MLGKIARAIRDLTTRQRQRDQRSKRSAQNPSERRHKRDSAPSHEHRYSPSHRVDLASQSLGPLPLDQVQVNTTPVTSLNPRCFSSYSTAVEPFAPQLSPFPEWGPFHPFDSSDTFDYCLPDKIVSLQTPMTDNTQAWERVRDQLSRPMRVSFKGLGVEVEFIKILGSGGFSEVHKVRVTETEKERSVSRVCALKLCFKYDKKGRPSLDGDLAFRLELRALNILQHRLIVKKLWAWPARGDDFHVICLELYNHGSVADYISRHGRMPLLRALSLFKSLVEALVYVHSHNFAHLDVKPANLLFVNSRFSPDPQIVLADFGCAMEMGSAGTRAGVAGTPGYVAPEVMDGRELLSPKADIYAAGVSLIEIISGVLLGTSCSIDELRKLTLTPSTREDYDMDQWYAQIGPVSDQIITLHLDLVAFDHRNRLDARQALSAASVILSGLEKDALAKAADPCLKECHVVAERWLQTSRTPTNIPVDYPIFQTIPVNAGESMPRVATPFPSTDKDITFIGQQSQPQELVSTDQSRSVAESRWDWEDVDRPDNERDSHCATVGTSMTSLTEDDWEHIGSIVEVPRQPSSVVPECPVVFNKGGTAHPHYPHTKESRNPTVQGPSNSRRGSLARRPALRPASNHSEASWIQLPTASPIETCRNTPVSSVDRPGSKPGARTSWVIPKVAKWL